MSDALSEGLIGPLDEDQLKKAVEDLKEKAKKKVEKDSEPITGGLILERSRCCNATIVYSEGGLKIKVCSKCGKPYDEPVYR